jgi:hypothetical protein
MNEWIEKSIELANSPGYLDRLHEIYNVTSEARRKIPAEVGEVLRRAYKGKDKVALVKALLDLDKFPIKDPYVAFLRKTRKKDEFLIYNPQTVERIAKRLFSMSFDAVIEGAEEPKEFNRQIGTLFGKWLQSLGHPLLHESEFFDHQGLALLRASDTDLLKYANTILQCKLVKAPDVIARKAGTHIVGEAKFLTDSGGHQNAQFADAMTFLGGREGNAVRVAILDGVVWLRSKDKMHRAICEEEGFALSGLLFDQFLRSIA